MGAEIHHRQVRAPDDSDVVIDGPKRNRRDRDYWYVRGIGRSCEREPSIWLTREENDVVKETVKAYKLCKKVKVKKSRKGNEREQKKKEQRD